MGLNDKFREAFEKSVIETESMRRTYRAAFNKEARESFALTVALSATGQWKLGRVLRDGKLPTWGEHLEQLDSNLSRLLPGSEVDANGFD